MTTATQTTNERAEILAEIEYHEAQILELKARLPRRTLSLWCFVLARPRSRVWVYAATRGEANQLVQARLAAEYGESFTLAGDAEEFTDPFEAARSSKSGNLVKALTPNQRQQFIADFRADNIEPDKKAKAVPQIWVDIRDWEWTHRRTDQS